jgi:PPOX class probable F420-dependent enzyme
MATSRANGTPQMSPVTVGVDDAGRVMISSREMAYKVRNLRRDPRASVCAFTTAFYGEWVQVDGTASIVPLPEAMDLLVDYYRRISGEHPDWDDYRAAMERDRRVMILIDIERAGPDRAG